MITYLITRHNLVSEPMISFIMPVVAVYFAAIGWGLWRLQKWARNLVIATSGPTLLLWLRAVLVLEWALGEPLLRDQLTRQTVFILVLTNMLIFLCLTVYPDVAKAFEADQG